MKLIIGLGNPGPEYAATRHNAGYMVVDKLARQLNAGAFTLEKKFQAEVTSVHTDGDKIILAKPTTFMNRSGEAVQALMQFYKIDPADTWIIYDDLDLPLGQIRIREEGGAGTHNGMKSITEYIGQDFPRIRVGIESRGASAPEQQDTSSFVLSPFRKEEKEQATEAIRKGAEALKAALQQGLKEAMNQYN